MLFKTNILALVTSDNNIDKLIIWDDSQRKVLCEFKFNHKILNVKLSKDKIVVICRAQIFIFNLNNFKEIDKIETADNPHGIVAISYELEQPLLAYPDNEKGFVKIKNLEKLIDSIKIKAHDNNIAYLLLSYNGKVLATASEKGTLIRIFKTENGHLLEELTRGKYNAEIKYICFEPNLKYIAVSSNRGTLHIWSLLNTVKNFKKIDDMESEENNLIANQKSNLSWVSNFLVGEYFNSEWSFAQIRNIEPKSIFCFGKENTIIMVSSDGKYYNYQIDLEITGNVKLREEEQFILE